MKPCVRFLQHLTSITRCKHTSTHFNCHYSTIFRFSTNTPSSSSPTDHQKSDHETPIRLSTQYPPPPIEERYSTPPSKAKSNINIEPYKDIQFKPKHSNSNIPDCGDIPTELQENNIVDQQSANPSTPEEELSLSGVEIDPLELRKMIPHGTASKEEIEEAINEENIEWKGVHWSERHYTAKLGDIVNRQRPEEISRLMESSKPALHRDGLRSIKPVEAGGSAYPIFYDPKTGNGLTNRIHMNLPKDIDGRKSRVTHIASLKKATGLNYSECALEYDQSKGHFSIALERLRNKQVDILVSVTNKSKDECKKIFDQCLGNFDKAFRKLRH